MNKLLPKETFKRIILTLQVVLLASVMTMAQATDNGGLTGSVYDPDKAVVPGATVKAININTGFSRTTTTNEEGTYRFPVLPIGRYRIEVTAEGFKTSAKFEASVQASKTTKQDIDLVLGDIGDGEFVVEVGSESGITIDDSGATPTTRITGEAIEKQPQVLRSAFNSTNRNTSLSGGIGSPLDNGTGNPEASVNGTRTTSSSVVIDGVDATNLSGTGSLTGNAAPAPEAVQEVSLLSDNYDASLGRSGGGSFQLITKPGGTDFHGAAYFYFQNENFNANDFFFNRDGIDRQIARRYEGGFTIGGPITKSKKTRFFASYQRTDAKTAYVPTASSFVVLPEALAFITDRTDPESVRQAFVQSVNNGGVGRVYRNGSACIRSIGPMTPAQTIALTCIDPSQVGFRLLSLRNPATGDFLIPTLNEGRFQRLFLDERNVGVFINGVRTTDFTPFGLPNGLPLLDGTFQAEIDGGLPLVRFRNVFPAEFQQDQIATRIDHEFNDKSTLTGTFFFSNFPSLDPFSDSTLVSPQPLIKDDKNRTLSLKNTYFFSDTLINEVRFGYFKLNNTRRLDDRFLGGEFSNSAQGITNPASAFVPGPETERLARFVGTGNLSDFSVNAPNDIFNRREQLTLTFANNVTKILGKNSEHTLRFGVEHKRNTFDTNLPEEQGIEFEGLINFTQLLTTQVPEADVALGITDKKFMFNDWSTYITDSWQVRDNLTLTAGVRWDWFGRPWEKNGRFTNFDFERVTDPNNILPGFIAPSNAEPTGFSAIDGSLETIARAENKHTLRGDDLNNFAPRLGFSWSPFKNQKTSIRGGYGIFYDRPSAGFINTVFTNYPFFSDIEASNEFNPATVQGSTAFANIDPNRPFVNNFPYFVGLTSLADTTPYILENFAAGIPGAGAEALEFRAVDRDITTPLIQQWTLGIQQKAFKNWSFGARYIGTRGQNLLLAVGFNQPYDLNDPNTPDYIYARLNAALTSVFPARLPAATPGQSERDRGTTTSNSNPRAFGACNPVFANTPGYAPCVGGRGPGGIDLNLTSLDFDSPRAMIQAAVRVPYLGFDPTDAIILQSRGYSIYHAGEFNASRNFANGVSFSASYTFSKSIDIGSTDPGSTAASGRPDTANAGLVVQGDQRDLNSNRGVSDFDRPHRFVSSFSYELPTFGVKSKWLKGWEMSGFVQIQSGSPFSIFATDASFGDPVASGGAFLDQFLGIIALVTERNTPIGGTFREERYNVGAGSGTIFDTAFGRPNVRSLQLLRMQGVDITEGYFNTCQDPNDTTCALTSPLGGFGNLGRNTLRGPSQKRFDLSFQKNTKFWKEKLELEFKADIFNVFNLVNFANPNSDLSDETDFGKITRTVGAPRVMQFGIKLRY